MSTSKNPYLEIVARDEQTLNLIKVDLKKYNDLTLSDQAEKGKQLLVSDKQKSIAMDLMRDELRDQQLSIKTYEAKLGRKLTNQELEQYFDSKKDVIVDEIDKEILGKLSKRLQVYTKLIK